MTADLFEDLAWLPRSPRDFRQRCHSLEPRAGVGRTIRRLATHSLDENQLRQLAAAIERIRGAGVALSPLIPLTVGLVGNGTLEPLVPLLVASGARHGLALRVVTASYGQMLQVALEPESDINRTAPDAIFLALDVHSIPWHPNTVGDAENAGAARALRDLETLREAFKRHNKIPCILQTVPTPPETFFGHFDRAVAGTLRSLTAAYNAGIVEMLENTSDVLFDAGALAETVGLARWYSPSHWNHAKLPFNPVFAPLYTEHVARLLGALRGQSRRCLILDLDNTLWGGVIGDDGIDGLALGQGSASGEAYLEVQKTALALRERGIVLAVSSKNDDAIAREPFRRHPEMLLREEHIAIFQANWDDKATNITAIAAELSLGIDAMVLLDDNSAERAFVRDALPEVAVPELSDDPSLYSRILNAGGYFEALIFSDEDRKRASYYEQNARRVTLQQQVGNLEAYLTSIEMRITFQPFDSTGRKRVVQLIGKSNQFNLTTRRYNETEVAAFESDPCVFTLQVSLSDTFGDNGMISVIICRPAGDKTWEIDTWLMSCRVLGRGVERMVLREILFHARSHGIHNVVGRYVPTERNMLTKDHYRKLGFDLIDESSNGTSLWQLSCAADVDPAPMAVVRSGFSLSMA